MRIVFFGTPEFAEQLLQTLYNDKQFSIVGVVTRPDKPKGRSKTPQPSAVKIFSNQNLLPLFQPVRASSPEFIEQMQALKADAFVVVAYGQILKKIVLDIPKFGCINVHASLLPKYRGAAPIQRAIMGGETITGVTIMQMDEGMDTGPMLATAQCSITSSMNSHDLSTALCELSKPLLKKTLLDIFYNNAHPVIQDDSQATYAPKIELVDTEVMWDKSADELNRLIHGVSPEPGAWCWIHIKNEKKRLRIFSCQVVKQEFNNSGDIVELEDKQYCITCGQNALILNLIQLEGKKITTFKDFLRGYPRSQLHFRIP
ncbi:MAG: methionyl-tRNA formyltransferase [Parachlamydiales bacterium]|nr:methionyl-tRNA formyltransferase [Parachlamydiales bacterium]